ncbi:hypothetical protein JXA02_09715 [candidate division KSB1 bacterium]|nr:hypothetical protein [candidate division KSB1 bacterium]RQW04225.1 MAG: hypothetical protein EH222_11505 [candidate division KSB1 bacterium]
MTKRSLTSLAGLDGVKERVTNYEGYGDASTRGQADKMIRRYLSGKITQLLTQLNSEHLAADEKDQNRLDSLLNSTKRKLATIHKSLNSPTYIDKQFFSLAALAEQRLARLYDLERGMLEEVANLDLELSDLNQKTRTLFEQHFLHIDASVDNINQALFEREALILGDVY